MSTSTPYQHIELLQPQVRVPSMISSSFIWFYMILYDFYDFIWFYMILYDFIWFYLILFLYYSFFICAYMMIINDYRYTCVAFAQFEYTNGKCSCRSRHVVTVLRAFQGWWQLWTVARRHQWSPGGRPSRPAAVLEVHIVYEWGWLNPKYDCIGVSLG